MNEIAPGGARIWRRELLGALVAAVLINLIGALGVPFTTPDGDVVPLEKPWFYPPNTLFGVVWTLLFSLMGVAVSLVYRRGIERRAVRAALGVFALQTVLNVAWSPTFFTPQAPFAALVIILVLWGFIVAFDRVDRLAALLLAPYLARVRFAAVLNYSLWRLN